MKEKAKLRLAIACDWISNGDFCGEGEDGTVLRADIAHPGGVVMVLRRIFWGRCHQWSCEGCVLSEYFNDHYEISILLRQGLEFICWGTESPSGVRLGRLQDGHGEYHPSPSTGHG